MATLDEKIRKVEDEMEKREKRMQELPKGDEERALQMTLLQELAKQKTALLQQGAILQPCTLKLAGSYNQSAL